MVEGGGVGDGREGWLKGVGDWREGWEKEAGCFLLRCEHK